MTCSKCGAVAEAGTRFCGNCGSPLAAPAAPPQGIQAKPTQLVHDPGATELPPAMQQRTTQYVPPEHVAAAQQHPPVLQAKPTTRDMPFEEPRPQIAAPATRIASEIGASVHSLVPPTSPVPQPGTELASRVPLSQVSDHVARPAAPVIKAPLFPETEANVRSLSLWYVLYGVVGLAAGAFMLGTTIGAAFVAIAIGVLSVVAGVLLFRCSPTGRMLSLVLAVATLLACVGSLVKPDVLPLGMWAIVGGVFALMSLVLLINGRTGQVCTEGYRKLSDAEAHEIMNLSSPYFWVPGVVTGVALIIAGLR